MYIPRCSPGCSRRCNHGWNPGCSAACSYWCNSFCMHRVCKVLLWVYNKNISLSPWTFLNLGIPQLKVYLSISQSINQSSFNVHFRSARWCQWQANGTQCLWTWSEQRYFFYSWKAVGIVEWNLPAEGSLAGGQFYGYVWLPRSTIWPLNGRNSETIDGNPQIA